MRSIGSGTLRRLETARAVSIAALMVWPTCIPVAQGQENVTPPETETASETVPTIPVDTDEAPQATAAEATRLDEVVVVAQKRAQRELDVPISISVIDDKFITAQGITDLRDLSLFVPNAKIHNTALFPDIRIRGFGTSPINPVFEQSVGLVLDGVPYGSKAFYQAALFDIEHVEVLRGPQGALYGKNTTAGLLNVITHAPGYEPTSSVDLQSGDLGHRRVEAALGLPLVTDFVNFRLAALDDQRDGYFGNTTAQTVPGAPAEPGARSRQAVRARLGFPDLLGSDLQLSYESSESALGGGYEFRRVPEHTRDFILQHDPNADFEPYNLIGGFDHRDDIQLGVDTVTANWSHDWGSWTLTAVGGYTRLSEVLENDTDFSPVPAAYTLNGRQTTLRTSEVRVGSPTLSGLLGLERLFGLALGESTFVAGAFFQKRNIDDLYSTLHLHDDVIVNFVAADMSGGGVPPVPPPPGATGDEQTTLTFDEVAESVAGFGQLDWTLLPRWTVAAGLRWSREEKQAHIRRVFDTDNSTLLTEFFNWEEFDRELERAETQISPKVSLNYRPTNDLSLFVSWGNAYKAGGFNAFASGPSDDELLFNPETVSQWAFDAKTRFFDGMLRLNLSAFRMDLEDFQVLTADPGNLKISIKNAARSRSQGVEADLTWYLAEWLTVRSALGYNDTEFLDFPIATCPQDMPNSDGDADDRCNVSGKPLVRAPRWSGTVTPMATLPFRAIPLVGAMLPQMFDDIGFVATVTGEYQGEQYLNDDLDERKMQEAFYRYRGSFGIGNLSQTWSLRLSGENLTDEATALAVGEIQAAPGHFYQIPEPGRVVYAHFRAGF